MHKKGWWSLKCLTHTCSICSGKLNAACTAGLDLDFIAVLFWGFVKHDAFNSSWGTESDVCLKDVTCFASTCCICGKVAEYGLLWWCVLEARVVMNAEKCILIVCMCVWACVCVCVSACVYERGVLCQYQCRPWGTAELFCC